MPTGGCHHHRMARSRVFFCCLFFYLAANAFAQKTDLESSTLTSAGQQIRPMALRAHMSFLADDLLEGRGTATRGHEIAARYVAAQLEMLGLEAGGQRELVSIRASASK
jgi:hypothetical protein